MAPPTTAPKNAKGFNALLHKKAMGIPYWGWATAIIGGLAIGYFLKRKQAGTEASSGIPLDTGSGGTLGVPGGGSLDGAVSGGGGINQDSAGVDPDFQGFLDRFDTATREYVSARDAFTQGAADYAAGATDNTDLTGVYDRIDTLYGLIGKIGSSGGAGASVAGKKPVYGTDHGLGVYAKNGKLTYKAPPQKPKPVSGTNYGLGVYSKGGKLTYKAPPVKKAAGPKAAPTKKAPVAKPAPAKKTTVKKTAAKVIAPAKRGK